MVIPLERKRKILDLLEDNSFMTVNDLAKKIYVSQMTIRRDLKLLEGEKLIKIVRGGAEAVKITEAADTYYSYSYRQNLESDIKRKLAGIAVSKIEKGDTIYIDSSSSASYIAEIIEPGLNISIITNSYQTASILAERNVKHTLIGGFYHEHEKSFLGMVSESCIDNVRIDKMFFSSQGIIPGDYVYDSSESETKMRQHFLNLSKKKYFMCLDYKIGRKYMFRVCPADESIEIILQNSSKGGDAQ